MWRSKWGWSLRIPDALARRFIRDRVASGVRGYPSLARKLPVFLAEKSGLTAAVYFALLVNALAGVGVLTGEAIRRPDLGNFRAADGQ